MTTSSTKVTWQDVEQRLDDAAATLRRMPPAKLRVEILRPGRERFANAVAAGGWEPEEREKTMRRPPPSAGQISTMEETLGWLYLVDDVNDRRIVWWRADHSRWPLWKELGISRTRMYQRWAAAVITIAMRLNNGRRTLPKAH